MVVKLHPALEATANFSMDNARTLRLSLGVDVVGKCCHGPLFEIGFQDPVAKPGRQLQKNTITKLCLSPCFGSVPTTPVTLILLQKYRDTNGRRIVIQVGGVYTTFCQEEGILLQKHRDRNGRCIAILFKSIGVRGRFDSPDCLCLASCSLLKPFKSSIGSQNTFSGPRDLVTCCETASSQLRAWRAGERGT